MRKSDKVFLSAVFAAAVATGKANAQQQQQDTASRRPYTTGHSGRGIFNWFHFGRRSSGNGQHSTGSRAEISSQPRNGGFGNSLRTSSAS